MLIDWFLSIKSLPNLLFGVLCLPGDQSHPVAQPTINPLACCICWARLLGRAVFPPWNRGPNSGSYTFLPTFPYFPHSQLWFFFFFFLIAHISGTVFLCLAYCTLHSTLQFHPCCCKGQNFLVYKAWIIFQCVYVLNQFFQLGHFLSSIPFLLWIIL